MKKIKYVAVFLQDLYEKGNKTKKRPWKGIPMTKSQQCQATKETIRLHLERKKGTQGGKSKWSQTSSGAHPASYTMWIGGSFPRGKAAGASC
jgi:hypothetical protein